MNKTFKQFQKQIKVSGIYCICNVKTNNFYIGKSKNLFSRWNFHLENLVKGKHHSKKMQAEFNKYAIKNFRFMILEMCPESLLNKTEIKYLKQYSPTFNTQNIQKLEEKTVKQKKSIEQKINKLLNIKPTNN